jgi:hypothetical protein
MSLMKLVIGFALIVGSTSVACSQVAVCGRSTFAAAKAIPEIQYDCPEGLSESSDELLKLPARLTAVSQVAHDLESFTDPAWWNADVRQLNLCELHGLSGPLTKDERKRFSDNDFHYSLLGNHQIRLVLVDDPCYQKGYNGSVIFLLYRDAGKVYVTKVVDGYYSRVDNSVDLDFANVNGQMIVEVATANSMPPAIVNFYFVIDPKTHQAVPKKIFLYDKKLTNEIASDMVMGEPADLGLPANASNTVVMRNRRLLPSVTIYSEAFDAVGNGRRLNRTTYHWNGRYYAPRLSPRKR